MPAIASRPWKACSSRSSGRIPAKASRTFGASWPAGSVRAFSVHSRRSASRASTQRTLAGFTERWMFSGELPKASWGCTYQPRCFISSAMWKTLGPSEAKASRFMSGRPRTRRSGIASIPETMRAVASRVCRAISR